MIFEHPSTPTILVADDEPIVMEMLHAILRREGYAVLTAIDADAALELGKTHREKIVLALLDYSLPGSNSNLAAYLGGFDHVRVVLMSGYTEADVRNCRVPYQRFAFLQKPFTRQKLFEVVRKSLDVPRPATFTQRSQIS